MQKEDALFLIFDTETTGLPPKGHEDDIFGNLHAMPRIFQLAAHLTTYDGKIIDSFSEFITPDGWEIPNGPNDHFWRDYGYTTELCKEKGVPMKSGLDWMTNAMSQATHIVAHNYAFDRSLLISELIRYNYSPDSVGNFPKPLCTMMTTINLVEAQFSDELLAKYPEFLSGKNKFPKLEELHQFLFGVGVENAHDAEWDLKATHKCLIELIERGIVSL